MSIGTINSLPSEERRTLVVGWQHLTLTSQFLIAGSAVLLIGMLIIGSWVTKEIEEGVTRNTAASTALYMDSFIGPRVQELAHNDIVSPQTHQLLDNIFKKKGFGQHIVAVKIWKPGGLIAYSSSPEIIGKKFPVSPELRSAWAGQVSAEFGDLSDEDDAPERAAGQARLEIYSPIRETLTGRIIAVGEFYEDAAAIKSSLFEARTKSWLVVAGATVFMMFALSGIVMRGGRTITRQRSQLQARVDELSALLSQNRELRAKLQTSSNRVAEINERYLHRIGADLHDGPAQLIGFALLRLDSLKPVIDGRILGDNSTAEFRNTYQALHDALREAMIEIRELSAGLTLAKLEEMSPLTILEEIVATHERRTGTDVALEVNSVPADLSLPTKIAVFRFVQEALNNAFRHGKGIDQTVRCNISNGELELEVADGGPGFERAKTSDGDGGLGLIGLRERIESLGATFQIKSTPGHGASLIMRCQTS